MSAFWMIFRQLPGAVKIVILFVIGYVLVRFAVDQVWWLTAGAIVLWSAAALWLLSAVYGASVMDILDKYTNKSALVAGLAKQPSPKEQQIDVEALSAKLNESVFGQQEVCRDVAVQIKMRFARTKRKEPIGVFLMAGPSATGKTLFAKALSEALYGKDSELHIEMAQFNEPHMVSQLFGQAPGYAGSDTYGRLTGALRDKPDRVVLLDEFEKACHQVRSRFLSAWNDGFITEASTAQRIPTTDAIFVLTTNAAQREIADLRDQFQGNREAFSDACKRVLHDHFKAEVLSRIDYVFPFLPLGPVDIARICAVNIEKTVHAYGLEIEHIDHRILLVTVQKSSQRNADPREIARMVERSIGPQVVAFKEQGVKRVHLMADGDGVLVAPA